MEKGTQELQETIRHLSYLLDYEQMERKEIADWHHAKLAGIAAARVQVQRLLIRGDESISILNELNDLLNTSIADLREINRVLYPKELRGSGLIDVLREYVKLHTVKYKSRISFRSKITDKVHGPKEREVAIYKLCILVMEFMKNGGFSQFKINVEQTGSILVVHFLSPQIKVSRKKPSDWKVQQERIKAMVIWQKAKVLEPTNWLNEFYFRFKLTEKLF